MDVTHPCLILEAGMEESHQWTLHKARLTVGRWPDNDIVLPDRLVSRHHAEIRRVGRQFVLEDRASTNGTAVNGQPILGTHPLQDGDSIEIAACFRLRFEDRAATAPWPAVREPFRLAVDESAQGVTLGGQAVPLSDAQYALLVLLVSQEGKVVTRESVVATLWPGEAPVRIHRDTVDAMVRRLRERLARIDPDHPYIQTVRGHGFRFVNRP